MSESPPSQAGPEIGKSTRKRRISSQALLAGEREIIIEHGLEQYRLQVTSSNKLILNK